MLSIPFSIISGTFSTSRRVSSLLPSIIFAFQEARNFCDILTATFAQLLESNLAPGLVAASLPLAATLNLNKCFYPCVMRTGSTGTTVVQGEIS
jgi:hypothetical protein